MPGHKVHRYLDRELFGKSYWKIHVKMDAPWQLLGREHRVLFHDQATAIAIAKEFYPNDFNAVQAALNHIFVDQLCSNDPYFKAKLEFLAEVDAKQRAKNRRERKSKKKKRTPSGVTSKNRRRRKSKDPVKELTDLIEKFWAIENLARELSK